VSRRRAPTARWHRLSSLCATRGETPRLQGLGPQGKAAGCGRAVSARERCRLGPCNSGRHVQPTVGAAAPSPYRPVAQAFKPVRDAGRDAPPTGVGATGKGRGLWATRGETPRLQGLEPQGKAAGCGRAVSARERCRLGPCNSGRDVQPTVGAAAPSPYHPVAQAFKPVRDAGRDAPPTGVGATRKGRGLWARRGETPRLRAVRTRGVPGPDWHLEGPAGRAEDR